MPLSDEQWRVWVDRAIEDLGAQAYEDPIRLDGGFTQATVWKINVGPARGAGGLDGRFVLKMNVLDESLEAARAEHFAKHSKAFAARHVARQVRFNRLTVRGESPPTVDYCVFQVAGRSADATSLDKSGGGWLAEVSDLLSRRLLAGNGDPDDCPLNVDPLRSYPLRGAAAFLESVLVDRIDPAQPRGRALSDLGAMLRGRRRTSIQRGGHTMVDPLAFCDYLREPQAGPSGPGPSRCPFISYEGMLHRDLHLGNVFVDPPARGASPSQTTFWLIDFGMSRLGPLLYDHAYFCAALLCQYDPTDKLGVAGWVDLFRRRSWRNLDGRPRHVAEAIAEVHRAVEEWSRTGMRVNRDRDLRQQFLLTKVAAGLNWACKPIAPHLKERAYLFAAENADEYTNEFCPQEHYHQLLEDSYDVADSPGPAPEPPPGPVAVPEAGSGVGPEARTAVPERIRDAVPGDEAASVPGAGPEVPDRDGVPAAAPSNSHDGPALSAHLLLNAWLGAGVSWDTLEEKLSRSGFEKLQSGLPLRPGEFRTLAGFAEETGVLAGENVRRFFEEPDTEDGLLRRLELVAGAVSPAGGRLRELIWDKLAFARAEWLDSIRPDLEQAARPRPTSERTHLLRSAYYRAGIRLTADQMARAALADFGHKRWLGAINVEPSAANGVLPHLRAANEEIGKFAAERLLADEGGPDRSRGVREISVVEGGVGGGHTLWHVLRALSATAEDRRRRMRVKYHGVELVPELAGRMDAMLKSPHSGGERADLFDQLRRSGRLSPLAADGRYVVAGLMEAELAKLRGELTGGGRPGSVDLFVSSFAFHHVPNGEAIVRFITNEAIQEFETTESLDRVENKDEVAAAMATGCRALYDAYAASLDASEPAAEYQARRSAVLAEIPATCPQAAVFLSLLDPGAITADDVRHFEEAIRNYAYPRQELVRMLANPQLDVLLNVQRILRDGGWLAIADPDGTSDFNAEQAYKDPELTVANFVRPNELAATLAGLGFESIEARVIVRKSEGFEAVPERHWRGKGNADASKPIWGYVVFARRSAARERELAAATHCGRACDPESRAEPEDLETVASIGRLLRDVSDDTDEIVDSVFNPPDPQPSPASAFGTHLRLRCDLLRIGWIQSLEGAAVLATKRLHRFRIGGRDRGDRVYVATDFPPTPTEVREGGGKVFSYIDEAEVLHDRIRGLVLDRAFLPPGSRVLDLCCGAGTLGLLVAKLRPDVNVHCVDLSERAVAHVSINRYLNAIDEGRLSASVGDHEVWNVEGIRARTPFRLIIADPPFALRPDWHVRRGQTEHGGSYGDDVSSQILERAHEFLESRGRLLMVAYSLLSREDGKLRLRPPADKLAGEFEPVGDAGHAYVWRYRHDKVAPNLPDGMPLQYMAIRLADPTRPESIIYQSGRSQREEFFRYTRWIDGLLKRYRAIQYVIGEFTKRE